MIVYDRVRVTTVEFGASTAGSLKCLRQWMYPPSLDPSPLDSYTLLHSTFLHGTPTCAVQGFDRYPVRAHLYTMEHIHRKWIGR